MNGIPNKRTLLTIRLNIEEASPSTIVARSPMLRLECAILLVSDTTYNARAVNNLWIPAEFV